jgi:hypothetical protein
MAEKKTWMPVVVGILNLICGGFAVLASSILAIIGTISGVLLSYAKLDFPPAVIALLFSVLAIALAIVGILAIIGGVYALQRRKWGMVLTGSIAALLPCRLFGIAAIVLAVLAKKEFE